jgi:uncharacterized membrane protein YgdD (TMEM256/DUF423 family)
MDVLFTLYMHFTFSEVLLISSLVAVIGRLHYKKWNAWPLYAGILFFLGYIVTLALLMIALGVAFGGQ